MNFFLGHPILSLAITFGLAACLLAGLIIDLRRKWQGLFGKRAGGSDAANQEAIARLIQVEQYLQKLEPRVRGLENIGTAAIQKVGFMRFNPFEHTGSDQSFAAAILDGGNNGIVISSLYTREGVRVYAKEIENGISKHSLSGEEQEVLREAVQQKPQTPNSKP